MRFLILGEAQSLVSHIEKHGGTVAACFGQTLSNQINCDNFFLPEADVLLNYFSPHIVKPHVLERFEGRSFNVHNGKLPEYAGIHVHQWAIRNGETSTAVTIHHMCVDVDAGDIVLEKHINITNDDTGLSLFQKTKREGLDLMKTFTEKLISGEPLTRTPQDLNKRINFTHKDALSSSIDWSRPATHVRNFIRAGSYHPFKSPTYTASIKSDIYGCINIISSEVVNEFSKPGTVIRIENEMPVIACGSGAIRLTRFMSNANTTIDWMKIKL